MGKGRVPEKEKNGKTNILLTMGPHPTTKKARERSHGGSSDPSVGPLR